MSANKSKIEWTETTWNPVTGCDRVSSGCQHCYAERLAHRLQAMGSPRYWNGFRLTIHRDLFDVPLRWKRPRMIFVNSMSDLFHEQIPDDDIRRIFDTMQKAHWHTFQVLTKRATRLLQLAPSLPWPDNIWIGVTVESQRYLHRVETLRRIHARVRFVSAEPLIGPLDLSRHLWPVHWHWDSRYKTHEEAIAAGAYAEQKPQGFVSAYAHFVNWVIVGGESGPGARSIDPDWVRSLRDQCTISGTSFFFKQWGGANKAAAGRMLDRRTWDEMPAGFAAPKAVRS